MQNPLPNQEQFLDLYRNGIRSASDVAQAWLQISLRLHEKQLEAMRGMVDESAKTAEKLGEARSIGELATVHSQLAGSQFRRVSEFWTSLWQAAAENQQAAMDPMRGQVRPVAANAPANHGKGEHRKSA